MTTPEESYPIQIGEDKYSLRFEDADVEKIEQEISLYTAFHPQSMKYGNAAVILWRGLRKEDPDTGTLVYAIQQGPPGRVMAAQMVKAFCASLPGPAGMMILYGSFMKGMVLSGWFGEVEKKNPDEPQKEPTEKN